MLMNPVNCVHGYSFLFHFLLFSFFYFFKGTGTQRSVAWTLQQSVRVQCGSNYLTAALPRNMAEALGVIGLFLNDRGCAGKRNATHWTVKTHVTSCGSTSRIDGKLTTYSNAVQLETCFSSLSISSLIVFQFHLFYLRFTSSWELPTRSKVTTRTLRARDWTAIRPMLPDRWPYPFSVTLNPISRLDSATSWMTTMSWYGIVFWVLFRDFLTY